MPSSSKWLFPLKEIESNVFSFFHSFSTTKCFILFALIFRLRLYSLSSKSVFVIKFACFNLAAKFSAVSLLNSGVVIYLPWLWSVSLFSILVKFVLYSVFFLTRLSILGILFSTAANAAFLAKPLTLGILFSISVILLL